VLGGNVPLSLNVSVESSFRSPTHIPDARVVAPDDGPRNRLELVPPQTSRTGRRDSRPSATTRSECEAASSASRRLRRGTQNYAGRFLMGAGTAKESFRCAIAAQDRLCRTIFSASR
jgi:hypothetical protein